MHAPASDPCFWSGGALSRDYQCQQQRGQPVWQNVHPPAATRSRKDPAYCGPGDHSSVQVLESIESRGQVEFPPLNMPLNGLTIRLGRGLSPTKSSHGGPAIDNRAHVPYLSQFHKTTLFQNFRFLEFFGSKDDLKMSRRIP